MQGTVALAALLFAASCSSQCAPQTCMLAVECRRTLNATGLSVDLSMLPKCGFRGNFPLLCCPLTSAQLTSSTTSTTTTVKPYLAASFVTQGTTTSRPFVATASRPIASRAPVTTPSSTTSAVRRPAPVTSSSVYGSLSQSNKGPAPLVLRENGTEVRLNEREPPRTKNNSAAYPGFNQVNSGNGGPITFLQQQVIRQETEVTKDLLQHRNIHLLPVGRCGRNAAESTERITIGYHDANLGEYPWVAQLGELRGDRFRHICGGSVISKKYILTAGSCIKQEKLTWVRLGEHDTSTEPDCNKDDCAENVLDIEIAEKLRHPRFDKPYSQNDIGLVRLKRALPHLFTSYIRPVCIPLKPEIHMNERSMTKLITVGWGLTNSVPKPHSDVLQAAEHFLISNRDCGNQQDGTLNKNIAATQLCVNSSDYMSTACQGDTGGPLMLLTHGYRAQSKDPVYMQVGIVSHGPGKCGVQAAPAIFTRVSSYAEWILDNIRE